MIHTVYAQVSFILIEVCQPGDAAIIFPKIKIGQHFYLKKTHFYHPKLLQAEVVSDLKTASFFTFKVALIRDNLRLRVINTFECKKFIVSIYCI